MYIYMCVCVCVCVGWAKCKTEKLSRFAEGFIVVELVSPMHKVLGGLGQKGFELWG